MREVRAQGVHLKCGCLIGTWTPTALLHLRLLREAMKALPPGFQLQRGSMSPSQVDHPRLWEYAMVFDSIHMQDGGGQAPKVLDVGGAGSLLSLELARCGARVWSTDLFKENVAIGQAQARALGIQMAVSDIDVSRRRCEPDILFDVVVSVNVIEHVMEWARKGRDFVPGQTAYWDAHSPSKAEVEAERAFVRGCAESVRSGGKLIVTFDYTTCGGFRCQPRCAYMRSAEDVMERIVVPSGMELVGPLDLSPNPNTDKFNPNASTGIVVMRKP